MSGCYVAFHKQLGDLTLLEPALARLRDFHGGPVRVFTRGGHEPLLALMPGVTFVRGIALAPAADLYCFDPLSKSAIRSLTAPVLRRHLVIPERRELQWFHPFLFRAPQMPELGDSYVAEFFWRHTPVPARGEFRPPQLERPPDDWAPPGVAARSFVLLNATAGWRMKMWTVEGWLETIRAFAGTVPFVLTNGGQGWQEAHCRGIVAGADGHARLLPTMLREFLWLCANARAVLTVDGSASHLAAAFGTPSLTIFGPTNIRNWHYARPSQVAVQAPQAADGKRPLHGLAAGPVIEASRRLVDGRGDDAR